MFWGKITEIMILRTEHKNVSLLLTQSTFADEPQTLLSSSIKSINKVPKATWKLLIMVLVGFLRGGNYRGYSNSIRE